MYSGSDQGSPGATHPQLRLKQRLLRLATVTGTGRIGEVCLSLEVVTTISIPFSIHEVLSYCTIRASHKKVLFESQLFPYCAAATSTQLTPIQPLLRKRGCEPRNAERAGGGWDISKSGSRTR
jgi:hypothetical protein